MSEFQGRYNIVDCKGHSEYRTVAPEEIEEAKDEAEFKATQARNRREWAAIEAALLEWRQRGYR